MAYELTRLTVVRATPAKDADGFDTLGKGVVLRATGKTLHDPATNVDWVNILIPPGVLDGWVPLSNCTEIPDPAPLPLDPESFVRQCTLTDRTLNSDPVIGLWSVTADFIIARALFETGMANVPAVLPEHDGPFRLSQPEWDAFLNSGLAAASDYQAGDVVYPMAQVYAAAFRMHADGKAVSQAMTAGLQPGSDPYLPSYLDLFHSYLIDAATVPAVRQNETNTDKAVADILPAGKLDAIRKRPQFSSIKDTATVPQFVAQTESVLAGLLDAAFEKIRTFAADELPRSSTAAVPWLNVAQAELAAGVTEANTPDRIKNYFKATDFGAVGATIPNWCGAFAAFCMKQSGAGDSIPKGSAAAVNWKGWGNQNIPLGSHDIPSGAVVVLTPLPGTDTSGHVGFFAGFSTDGKKAILLGGNQSDSVRETGYEIPRIAAIRMLQSPIVIGAANRFDLTAAGVKKKFQQYGDLIVDRFQRAGFTKDQHLLAALANAIVESGLDPTIKSPIPEESYGLFQCNRTAGLGKGYSVEQLKDPEINISIIIREARKYSAFTAASSTESAIDAFVRFIERPKNTPGAISKRNQIAKLLV
ncbi:hypothetical protein [Mesorhizobium sp. CA7]|uniref:hypothetical protein n=1 Tax=Mesorhizobium sp. CA7 TaxID=588501 RepID=UPI001CCD5C35|nr:hypothetical protein [Mesorhizobium sp. CA7]MBZ9814756.1 hypothetical protein [Mesorhizobium sp. CA7]